MPLKHKSDFAETYEGHALRRISEIMGGLRCVYCLGPVTPKSPKMRKGKLPTVCSPACGFNARGTLIIGGPHNNSADFPIEYKIEKPAPLA
jgi:hypothetical protein